MFNATFNPFTAILCGQFFGGGNRSTVRKPTTCGKSLSNFTT